jgi:hypothetical protein
VDKLTFSKGWVTRLTLVVVVGTKWNTDSLQLEIGWREAFVNLDA